MLSNLALKIRRRETPFYDRLYLIAKATRGFEIPPVWPVYHLLAFERSLRLTCWRTFTRVFYYTPIFKLRCRQFGKRLHLIGGSPLVLGHLQIVIGADVQLHGYSTFVGAKVFDRPTLTIGNGSHLGYQMIISVGADVTIGDNVLIGDRVSLLSYDGHPTNPSERHLPASKDSSRPIVIGNNVWICSNSTILKGVTVGDGAIIGNGCVVSKNVPPNSVAVGNPARFFLLPLSK